MQATVKNLAKEKDTLLRNLDAMHSARRFLESLTPQQMSAVAYTIDPKTKKTVAHYYG